jgi:hypothetical protein
MSLAVLNSSLCAASAIEYLQKLHAQSGDSLELEIYISQFLLGLHSMQTYRRCRMMKMCMTDNVRYSFLLELLHALRKAGALADDYDKTRIHKFMITKSAVSTCMYILYYGYRLFRALYGTPAVLLCLQVKNSDPIISLIV